MQLVREERAGCNQGPAIVPQAQERSAPALARQDHAQFVVFRQGIPGKGPSLTQQGALRSQIAQGGAIETAADPGRR